MISLTLAYMMGLVLGRLFSLGPLALFLYSLALLACLVGLGIGKWREPPRARRRRPGLSRIVRFSPLLLACVLLGHAHLGLRGHLFPPHPRSLSHYQFPGPVDLTGTLCLPPEVSPGRLWLYLEVEEISWQGRRYRVEGRARIAFYALLGSGELAYGDRLEIRQIWLRPARGFRNFGGFDYEAYLAQRGIQALGSLSRPEGLSILARNQGSPGWAWIYRLRGRMLAFLDRAAQDPGRASLKAIVLGERGALSPEMVRVFNESGITHLLAISGQQVGLVALAAFGLLRHFLAFVRFDLLFRYPLTLRPSKVAALLTFWPVLLYSLLVGGGHSVTRATLMVAVYLATVILDRPRDLAHTLALAALLILLWQPEALFDIGFQLSFAAVGGILLAVSRFPSRSEGEGAPSIRRKLSLFLLISLYANLSTLPLVVYYFQRISLVGPLTNLAAIPLSSAAVPLGLLACLLSLVHDLLAIPPLAMSLLLFDATYFLARMLARLPQASIPLPAPSILTLIAFYTLLISTVLLRPAPRERRGGGAEGRRDRGAEEMLPRSPAPLLPCSKWAASISALILVLSLSWRQIVHPSTGLLRATFVDLGPGEASLLRLPGGKTLLYLGGGLRPWGLHGAEGAIASLLHWEGVDRIDWLVAGRLTFTHLKML
ncbi:MAG: ComEC/Rec2 family competence protein, partial [Nitrospinae bacterium]|nr:ComEC/Rec2 family competence protein [Nitrospinota bacterium]